jgi:PAS domain S-box-containing protein
MPGDKYPCSRRLFAYQKGVFKMTDQQLKDQSFLREKLKNKINSLDFLESASEKGEILRLFDNIVFEQLNLARIHGYIFNNGSEQNSLYERIRILDAFFKYTLTPLIFLDTKFNYIGVNQAYSAAVNLDIEEFADKNYFDMFPDKDHKEAFERALREKRPYEAKGELFRADGNPELDNTYWDWSLVPITNHNGRVEFLVLSLKDVTEVKLAQIKLAASEVKYRQLVENSNSIIIKRTVDGRITFLNEYAQEFFGYSKEEIIGRNIVGTIVPHVDSEGRDMEKLIRRIGERPSLYVSNENQNMLKDGTLVWVLWRNKPITDFKGNIVGVMGIGVDVTDRKHNESLVQMTNTLLDLFVRKETRKQYLDCAVGIIRKWSGMTCAGIRLKDSNGTIPYVSCLGYEAEFIEMENKLRIDSPSCLCARIAGGHPYKSDKQLAAGKRSYAINDADKFLKSLSPEDRENYKVSCLLSGFNSLMIVPIIYQKQIRGIIHLADREANKANRRIVEMIETVALILSEAIHRFDIEDRLKETRDSVSSIISAAPVILLAVDAAGIITLQEGDTLKKMGLEPGDSVGKSFFDVFSDRADMSAWLKKALDGEVSKDLTTSFNDCHFNINLNQTRDDQGKVTGVIAVATDVSDCIEAREKILEYQTQLRSLNTELVLAQERERRRIAEQLHDCLGPTLSHLTREIGLISQQSTDETAARLCDINHHLRGAVANTRSLTFSISPPALYKFGYEYAIEELCEEFGKIYKIKFNFECTGHSNPINEQSGILIFSSVRELMLNIVKHSNVRSASVVINKEPDNVKIIVFDNGDGFDVSKLDYVGNKHGYGLFSIKERVRHLGGYIDINSQPKRGAEIVIHIPVVQ